MNVTVDLAKLGIEQLSAMQLKASDSIAQSGRDVILLSPTGSGKTLAYLLPILQKLDVSSKEVQAVVIVPNRELAIQSAEVLQLLTKAMKGFACYGGRPAMDEHRQLRQVQPQIVFATPGRLNDHLDKRNISIETIQYVVIDEFDKCLEMGFQEEMSKILEKLTAVKQRILLSATDAVEIPHFVNMNNVDRLDYLTSATVSHQVRVFSVRSPDKDKLQTLKQLLLSFGNQSTIVFTNYRESAERIHDFLTFQHFYSTVFHGGLDQQERESSIYKFSNGSVNILVSTDLASRGLDIPDVDNIVHYQLPDQEENYVHRTGRTARWEKEGRAFLLIGPTEVIPAYTISHTQEYSIPVTDSQPALPKMATIYIGKGKKDKISKMDVVGFLCKKCQLAPDEIGRIDVNNYYVYVAVQRNKLQEVLKRAKGQKIKGLKTIFEAAE
ncbi:DEAD/DEAH box helicase [Hoylesella timonensis]|jgi:hypothetical protein|uniref:Helicase n=1 Tax=Hoylesella timonensis S9-PR14 TaxID=1401062 RepID=A0A098YTN2_9BACT|nr:DEAD/DEAH box helicase [Hoylesella timonensis]KGI22739.1 helicase [Hoylesella timonensis S9-PR14]